MSSSRERARLLQGQERYELSERAWREVLGEDPNDAEAHACLALCLCEREQLDEAEREAGIAIGAAPDQPFTHYALSRVLRQRNRFAEAITAISAAIRLDPEDADYRAVLANIHAVQQQWRKCLEAADRGLALDARHLGCANLRALSLTHLDLKDEAAATIAGALAQAPNNSLTHTNQGWALLHAGDAATALVHFREALRLAPGNDWAREGLLTAIKARNPLFRMMLAFFLFMSRQSGTVRWLVFLGIFFGQQIMVELADRHPTYGVVLWPIVITVAVFVFLTWLANPLMNLMMRLHPMGRHALTPDQSRQSLLVGLALAVAALNFGLQCFNGGINPSCLYLLFVVLPVSSIHAMQPGWPRQVATAVGILIAIAALDLTVTAHLYMLLERHGDPSAVEAYLPVIRPIIDLALAIRPYFFYCIIGWSLAVPFLSRVQPRR